MQRGEVWGEGDHRAEGAEERAATATRAAMASRRAKQHLMATKYKIRKPLPPTGPPLFQDKIATTQEINQTRHLCCVLMTGRGSRGSGVRSGRSS